MKDAKVGYNRIYGRRLVLIVDDEEINREILQTLLEEDYDVIKASNGLEALSLIHENSELLSLIILDLFMPVCDGMSVLRKLNEENGRKIPIIVMTSDLESEVECLELGASDFILKPYPPADVILARVKKTIELSEDRQIIDKTERDKVTGLFHREFFYNYCKQFDITHQDIAMDAFIMDIRRFHIINERFGTEYGDDLLRKVADILRGIFVKSGDMVCRNRADRFMIYCRTRDDYEDILDTMTKELSKDESLSNKISLRFGIYKNVDKNIMVDRRFDRARMALDSIKANISKHIAIYDADMLNKEMYETRLIEDFPKALKEKQFLVYYQPKYNVKGNKPILSSAEALVRWKHPELGLISPGIFIPLFEKNGLIYEMDNYVWNEVANQVKKWKNKYNKRIPVSVNVSRVDMYDPHLKATFEDVLKKNDLTTDDMLLEITESAYVEDSKQIIEIVNGLRDIGFKIEMDDFGTGYSSLSMISMLPIDILKLDMQFIKGAFIGNKDTKIIEIILDIANYLSVPVIAEGVETKEQMEALKEMGCDIIQGFYFSKPLPVDEFEQKIEEKA